MDATHLLTIGAELGEGPVWIRDALWFVDIKGRHIYRHTPATGATDRWNAPEMVGWILPAERGDTIVGLQSGPHRFAADTGQFETIAAIDAHRPANRLNDAAVDARGRLYFGTMDDDEAIASGQVYVLDRGVISATSIAATIITNGPAIAPSGDRFYHVDTLARTITTHTIADDGMIGVGEPFLSFTADEGYPDGATCDAEGGVWVGFYGGWAARRFSPTGAMTTDIRFPVANVTKVALGGPDGRTAYATAARQGLGADALRHQPLAGDVFTFPVAVPAASTVFANS